MNASTATVAAIDLGATSGRVIVGEFSAADGLRLTEAYRFPNQFHTLDGRDYWDLGRLWSEVRAGLAEAKERFPALAACGVDTWGVDSVLLNERNRILHPTHAYRDVRTHPIVEEQKRAGEDRELYRLTGIQPITFNTLNQLTETLSHAPGLREDAARCLLLPDFFNYLLSGAMVNEVSIASTGQLLDLEATAFSDEVLERKNIPARWFEGPSLAGQALGPVIGAPGLDGVQNVLVPGHDTSIAFESIPPIGNDLLVSAGTWMLVGGLTPKPVAGDEGFAMGITNERDGRGGYRPNRIIVGLWLLEQLLPGFSERPQSDADWDALIGAAENEPVPGTLLDLNDPGLFNPDDMRAALDANVRSQGARPPDSLAAYTRLICDSLGREIAETARAFGELSGEVRDNIVMVGGGSKNRLLCQRAADFAGTTVTSLAMEGSSVGNIAYQLMGLGAVESLGAFHQTLLGQIERQVYEPDT